MTVLVDPTPTRIGLAILSHMSFVGGDLNPLRTELTERITSYPGDSAALMDMAVIAQIIGNKEIGLALQAEALTHSRIYRLASLNLSPQLRLLTLVYAGEMGDNTPVEFLLGNSDVELLSLYILPGAPLPDSLPPYDIMMVSAPDSDGARPTFDEITRLTKTWSKPVINHPDNISRLNRDRLYLELHDISGLYIPITARISKSNLAENDKIEAALAGKTYPLIIRPIDSQAGRGLSKLADVDELNAYLAQREENEFFISNFIDYRSADGLFRKYRVVFVDGKAYACHMAIAEQWDIWYLNAYMAFSSEKCAEEKHFMVNFDQDFAQRHAQAFAQLAERIGLEYFAIDCGELISGELLIFEAGNTMLVHDMDSPLVFPYKSPQMKKIFQAFIDMLYRHAGKQAIA